MLFIIIKEDNPKELSSFFIIFVLNKIDNERITVLGSLGGGELILIALVILLLFGGKKIPELMKGLGKGVKSFKDGMNEIEKDIKDVNNNTEDKN